MQTTIGNVLEQKGHDVWSLPPSATIHEAIQTMAQRRIEAVVVVEGGTLVGILTERDCARRVTLRGSDTGAVRIRDVMTSPVTFVGKEHTVGDCLAILSAGGFAHLPVVEGDALVGVVSMGDLVNTIIREQGRTISHLEGYISGQYPG